jgi:hypothetical protein
MNLRACRVTISDMDGVQHTAKVTASSLYEAVALGLAAIREQEWANEIPGGLNTVEVAVNPIPVTHTVRIQDFKKWLKRSGGSPHEVTQRDHLRRILGLDETGQPPAAGKVNGLPPRSSGGR